MRVRKNALKRVGDIISDSFCFIPLVQLLRKLKALTAYLGGLISLFPLVQLLRKLKVFVVNGKGTGTAVSISSTSEEVKRLDFWKPYHEQIVHPLI